MMMRGAILGVTLLLIVGACSAARSESVRSVTSVPSRCVVRKVSQAHSGGMLLNRTYSDSFPSSECRSTNLGLEVLHDALTLFFEAEGAFPDSLVQIMTLRSAVPALSPRAEWLVDGWGVQFEYRRVRAAYVLRSAGPDRRFDSNDDLIDSTRSAR